jgi:hypothetical protein
MRGSDGQGWNTTSQRYWLGTGTYYERYPLLKPQFQDFYYPQNLTTNVTSWTAAIIAWQKITGDNSAYASFVGPNLMVTMSIFHRAIVATGNYNDTRELQRYIEANEWPTMFGRYTFNYAGVVEGVDRTLSQFSERNMQQMVFPPEYADTSLIWPMPLGCPPPAPTATSVCDRLTLKWVSSSISFGSNGTAPPGSIGTPNSAQTSIVITSPLIVNGNVSIGQVTIVLNEGNTSESGRTLDPAVINATGCVSINGGTLQLPFTVNGTLEGDFDLRTLIISQSGCLSGKFDQIAVLAQNLSDPCASVSATPTYSERQLSVIFTVSRSSERCATADTSSSVATWIIAIAIVIPVVAIIAIVVILLAIPATRNRIAPGWNFRRRIQHIRNTSDD